MSFLDEVHTKRQKLADVLSDEDYSGIRDIVEELYPDRAHFIYELLQNAEDTGASKASFRLEANSVSFEHNGLPFSKENVWGITNIGKGSKKDQEDQIGRFGVGFKAVFAYTENPHIWSPTFSFAISELVLPAAIPAKPDLGQLTRFEFPFNNPKKIAEDAYPEVEAGLNELAETTLLFLSHLESIQWQNGQRSSGEVLRLQHSENHFEVVKNIDGKTAASSHYLRFSESVEGLAKQHVSVAFALDCLPNVTAFDPRKSLAKQLRIVPANPGRVAVFFPAEKETSGLRFHLHAPFVPELSRASVKETTANNPLFKQLTGLAAASLHYIRDLKLLTVDFLSVLPNPQDAIPARYQPIRAAILAEMNNHPLTPTHAKSHAPAKHLLQAKASLKELLSPEDIEFLVDYEDHPPQWAIGATQKHSHADRFLSGLEITDWDIDYLVEHLIEKASEGSRYISSPPSWVTGPDQAFMSWLSGKSLDWHQRLYSLLYMELSNGSGYRRVKNTNIVRLIDGSYSAGSRCFFPSEGSTHDGVLPRVDAGVFSAGRNKSQQENARKFLEAIGVREVGEAEQVEAILKQRYTREAKIPDKKTYRRDFKKFVSLVESEPDKAKLFKDFYIFECDGERWCCPTQVFLDEPFLDIGLRAYFDALGDKASHYMLCKHYEECGVAIKRVAKFAEAVGVRTHLECVSTSCYQNPQWSYLSSVAGDRSRSPINTDYAIPHLKELLEHPDLALSKLIWRTMRSLPAYPNFLQATYRKSERGGSRYSPSQLVHHLRSAAWVPQGDGIFARPAEASRDLLPAGFPFDPGWAWLEAIQFGQQVAKKSEEQRQRQVAAKLLEIAEESIQDAQWFAALTREERQRFRQDHDRQRSQELPDHESGNPDLRAERVRQQAAEAPEKITEERVLSVTVGHKRVKEKAAQYLRQQYTNNDGEMICQVCKAPLPFKLDDGNFYVEKIPFLTGLKKPHYQNHLALCPNHAAMYEHANGSEDSMQLTFSRLERNELEVVLAQQQMTIYFTKTHIADLKAAIEADKIGAKS